VEEYWQVLGLDEPPADIKSVKRAYAARLKVTRPDDDPHGFMKLRDALEEAKYRLDNKVSISSIVTPISAAELEVRNVIQDPELEIQEIEHEIQEPNVVLIPQYQNEINRLINHPKDRNDKEVWTNFIQSISRESSLDEYAAFNTELRQALLERLGYNDGDETKRNFATDIPFIESPVAAEIFRLMDWTEPQNHGYFIGQELEWLLQDFRLIKLNRVSHSPRSKEFQELMRDRSRRQEEIYRDSNYAFAEKLIIGGVFIIIALVIFASSTQ